MRRQGNVWLWMALAVVLAGCGGSADSGDTQAGPEPELVAMRRPPIEDLPVPIGFYLDEGKSRNFHAAGARYIDHAYKGSADKFAVGRFYKRQMPISRWTLVTDMFVQGNIVLDFEKDTERCRISISGGGLFEKTRAKVAVWTSGRMISPPGVGRSSRPR